MTGVLRLFPYGGTAACAGAFAWLMLAAPALARSVHIEPRPTPAKTEAEPDDDTLRANRPNGVALRAGYFGSAVLGAGVEAYHTFGTWEVGVAGYYGTADLTSAASGQLTDDTELAGYTVDKVTVQSSTVEAEVRSFVYEHLAWTAAVGYRRITGDVVLTDATGDGQLSAAAAVGSVVVAGSVGSFWTWASGFYAGVDWIGLTVPLSSSAHVSTAATGTAAAGAQSDFQAQAESLTKSLGDAPGIILLLGSVGYRF